MKRESQRTPWQTFQPPRAKVTGSQAASEDYQTIDTVLKIEPERYSGDQDVEGGICNPHGDSEPEEAGNVCRDKQYQTPTTAQSTSAVNKELPEIHFYGWDGNLSWHSRRWCQRRSTVK